MIVGCVPEDDWSHSFRLELKLRSAHSAARTSDDNQVMEVHSNGEIFTFYSPAHSVDSLEFQLMLITPSGVSDN
jgi:hypothetical protein